MSGQVKREVVLEAPREDVWEALTDPDRLACWLADEATIDLRPGGGARFRLPGGEERTGFVETVRNAEELSFWWRGPDPDDELTHVRFTLADAPGGTRLRVVESAPVPVAAGPRWTLALGTLAATVGAPVLV